MSNTALLVIDVQQGLCEGDDRAFDADGVIARINRVSAHARAAGIPVIFVQHETAAAELVFGSREWQLADGLQTEPGDLRIRKTTPDAFHRTELQALLERHRVIELTVCGMHTEFCVDTSIRRALGLGYPVTLVSDAHTSTGNAVLTARQIIEHHNVTLTHITSYGPRVRAVASDAIELFASTAAASAPGGTTDHVPIRLSAAVPILSVADVAAAVTYYQQVLGFTLAWAWGDPLQLASVCRDGVELNLSQASGPTPATSKVYVQMSGVDAYCKELIEAGATITVPLVDRAYGMRDFKLVDPSGHELSFGEPVEVAGAAG